MADSYYELLANSLGSEEDYYNDNLWYQGAQAMSQTQFGTPRNSTEAFLMPLLQGFGTSYMAGRGKSQARESMFDEYKASPLLSSYADTNANVGPMASGADYENLLRSTQYLNEDAPSWWSPKQAQNELALGILEKQKQDAAIEARAKLEQEILAKTDPRVLEFEAQLAGAKESAKANAGGAKPDWWKDVPTADKTKLTQLTSAADSLESLANDFANAKMDAPEFQVSKKISGTKANELYTRMVRLVPIAARMMGEVGNLAEQEQQRQIESTLGNVTSGTEGAASRIKDLVALTRQIAEGKMQSYKTAKEGGGDALIAEINKAAEATGQSPTSSSIPAGAVPTGKTSKGRPVYLYNGVEGVFD